MSKLEDSRQNIIVKPTRDRASQCTHVHDNVDTIYHRRCTQFATSGHEMHRALFIQDIDVLSSEANLMFLGWWRVRSLSAWDVNPFCTVQGYDIKGKGLCPPPKNSEQYDNKERFLVLSPSQSATYAEKKIPAEKCLESYARECRDDTSTLTINNKARWRIATTTIYEFQRRTEL